jgi:hypothetical protein
MSERDGRATQQTLTGRQVDAQRVRCSVYRICDAVAEFEVDGEVTACRSCAEEFTEPESPEEASRARRLTAVEMWDYQSAMEVGR